MLETFIVTRARWGIDNLSKKFISLYCRAAALSLTANLGKKQNNWFLWGKGVRTSAYRAIHLYSKKIGWKILVKT